MGLISALGWPWLAIFGGGCFVSATGYVKGVSCLDLTQLEFFKAMELMSVLSSQAFLLV